MYAARNNENLESGINIADLYKTLPTKPQIIIMFKRKSNEYGTEVERDAALRS